MNATLPPAVLIDIELENPDIAAALADDLMDLGVISTKAAQSDEGTKGLSASAIILVIYVVQKAGEASLEIAVEAALKRFYERVRRFVAARQAKVMVQVATGGIVKHPMHQVPPLPQSNILKQGEGV